MRTFPEFVLIILFFTARCCGAFGRLGHFVIGEALSQVATNSTLEWVFRMQYFAKFNNSWGLAALEADNFKSRPALRWTAKYHYLATNDNPPTYCPGVGGWNSTKGGNILKGIERFTNLLLTSKGDAFSATMLIHLLQDLQGWHTSGKFRGGNDVIVIYNGRRVNLHRLWDSVLVQELTDRAGGKDALIAEVVSEARPRFCAASALSARTKEWDFMRDVVAKANAVEQLNCKVVWRDELRTPEVLLPIMKGLLVDAVAFSACHWDHLAAEVLKKENGEKLRGPGQLLLNGQ